jgi:tetratricopeptide (TPR) repeat protein
MKYKMRVVYLIVVFLFPFLIINISHGLAQDIMQGQAREYFREGLEAQTSGDIDLAISLYTKAIYARPDYSQAHNNLGTAYAQKHDYVKAEEEYNKAVIIEPKYATALKNLAIIYAERKDYEKFNEYWKRATGLSVYSPFLIDDEDYQED